jgi:PIN domain nuclease of toxin-antitoxin system
LNGYVTDTHGLIWYLEDDSRLSARARFAFDECDNGAALMYIPSICIVEMVYLQEKGRIPANLLSQLLAELRAGTTGLRVAPMTEDIASSTLRIPRGDVPDMPDRIIAATALVLNLPLVTKDSRIAASSSIVSIW